MKRVLIHSPYWRAQGGGERYALTVAECLQGMVEVYVTVRSKIELDDLAKYLGLRLERVKIFNKKLSKFDLFKFSNVFWVSDGSIPSIPLLNKTIHFQAPFQNVSGRNWKNRLKLMGAKVVCNSQFTKKFIDKEYGVKSSVIYPPIETDRIIPKQKENLILSVGRFSTSSQHKRPDVIIEMFKTLLSRLHTDESRFGSPRGEAGGMSHYLARGAPQTGIRNWRLVIVGNIEDEASTDIVKKLRMSVRGFPIVIKTDMPHGKLIDLYARTAIYWHAAGFGVDLEEHPEKAEHFGISTVEAMAAGAVPLSYAAGGQMEIIDNGSNGFLWSSPTDLIESTLKLIRNPEHRQEMAEKAISKSKSFSRHRFCLEVRKLFK